MEEDFKGFNPDIQLDRAEQASLASTVSQPGFADIQKIGKACVDTFVVNWINQEKEEDVLRAHKYAKISAMLYTMLIARISSEVYDYVHTQPQPNAKPIDSTEDLDIGEHTKYGEDVAEESTF